MDLALALSAFPSLPFLTCVQKEFGHGRGVPGVGGGDQRHRGRPTKTSDTHTRAHGTVYWSV